MSSSTTPCPGCGAAATGKFCSECGAALVGARCGSCQTLLTPGAQFCHRCGAGVSGASGRAGGGGRATAGSAPEARSIMPWVVAGAALLAVVIMVANQQSKATPAAPQGMEAPFAGAAAGGGAVRAPDISQMSPQERADRLYDRVMKLAAEGKSDSASFFASMAVGAYESLAPLNADQRYDMGRMAEMAGDLATARAQSDTILREQPDHLLGIILAARVVMARGDSAMGRQRLQQLVKVEATERAKSLEEYERHRGDIDAALALV
ncbi:MAG: zinc ribbon domain-containing protein, partial [Gemmatimonadetes bacterium]|nr:zinc ribbon domain-containing protein [Gemmatimonadota bacterium]